MKHYEVYINEEQLKYLRTLIEGGENCALSKISKFNNIRKKQVLDYYFNPFKLYGSNFEEEHFEEFKDFLINRYDTELQEITYQYKNKDLTKTEFLKIKDSLDENYFSGNPVAINLGRIYEKEKSLKTL